MFLELAGLIAGFVLLIKAADILIDGSATLAIKFHISEIAVGLTIVSFGTSAPELIVNIISAFKGHPEICYGNVIGSNIFNLLIVLGIAGLISPLLLQKDTVRKEIPISLAGAFILLVLSNSFWTGGRILSRLDGMILFSGLLLFIYYVLKLPRNVPEIKHQDMSALKSILLIAGGITGLFIGGEFVVRNSVSLALQFGVSEKFISLTIVAIGTSLPELVTSIIAVRKKSSDIAVGNVVGSNIFNIFGVIGITAILKPISYNTEMDVDLLILMLVTMILYLLLKAGKHYLLNRLKSAILVILYGVYIYYLLFRG
ncbi:MAG: calcium/sodium antiporter [Candidatus Cloacimonetes bacterium]|nr:calcium/sodium antiporter [Candidatus Cloacimonadota bacterium]